MGHEGGRSGGLESGDPAGQHQKEGQRGRLAFSDMPPGVFDGGVPVDVGKQAQAEAVLVVGWVSEAVHQDTGGGGMKRFPHAVVELIVDNRAPVFGLLIGHGLDVYRRKKRAQSHCRE